MVGNDRSGSHPQSSPADDADVTVVSSVPVIDAPAPSSGSKALAPGVLLGHTYRIEALLARGGMGEVYRARHEELGSLHAIKVILDDLGQDAKIINMFQEEAKKLRRVRDDAVVGYEGLFRDEFGRRYLVMELVDGPSLSDIMKERKLTVAEVGVLRDRMARGLAAAHEKGIYHRDISPDNVIFPGGRVENAKIIDFGIAKSADPSDKTVIGDEFAGKYSYVSPEQLGMYDGKVDGRSDMYSLALVLIAALNGRKMDMGASIVKAIDARRGVPDLSGIPATLRPEFERMLQPQAKDRFPDIRDLISSNETTQSGGQHRQGAVPDAAKAKRSGLIGVAALAAAVVVVGGGLYAVMGTGDHGGGGKPVVLSSNRPSTTTAETTTTQQQSPPTTTGSTAPLTGNTTASGQPSSTTSPTTNGNTATSVTPSSTAGQQVATSVSPSTVNPPVVNPTVVNPTVVNPPTVNPPGATSGSASPNPTTGSANSGQTTAGTSNQTVQEAAINPPSTATIAPPKANPAVVRATLQQILGGYSCSRLTGKVASDLTGSVSGFVENNADATKLRSQLAGLTDVRLSTDVAVHGWPHCGVLAVLASDTHDQGPALPSLQLDKPNTVYKAGQTLNIKATMARSGCSMWITSMARGKWFTSCRTRWNGRTG